jgi:hypothetical protein
MRAMQKRHGLQVNSFFDDSGLLSFCSFPMAEKLPQLFRINENESKQSKLKLRNLRRKIFLHPWHEGCTEKM